MTYANSRYWIQVLFTIPSKAKDGNVCDLYPWCWKCQHKATLRSTMVYLNKIWLPKLAIWSGVEARVPIRAQRLLHNRHNLPQSAAGGLNLKEGIKLCVGLRKDIGVIMMAKEIVIYIKIPTATRKTVTVRSHADATIMEVKAKIFAQEGMNFECLSNIQSGQTSATSEKSREEQCHHALD